MKVVAATLITSAFANYGDLGLGDVNRQTAWLEPPSADFGGYGGYATHAPSYGQPVQIQETYAQPVQKPILVPTPIPTPVHVPVVQIQESVRHVPRPFTQPVPVPTPVPVPVPTFAHRMATWQGSLQVRTIPASSLD